LILLSSWQSYDDGHQVLSRLVLYTRKNAMVLKITYQSYVGADGIEGEIQSVEEPLDRFLSDRSLDWSIVRIRPGPQTATGFAALTPGGSFAALVENRSTCEYSLLLHHCNGNVTDPVHVALEYELEESVRFTDFCFGQSAGELCLFPSLSILLLKGNGDVYSASPVVFDGSVVTRNDLDQANSYLRGTLDQCRDRTSAKWKQGKAAMGFLVEVFDRSENRNNLCTAKLFSNDASSPVHWPVKLQGPLLFNTAVEQSPLSCAIDNFGCSECIAGLAIAKTAGKIDFAALSPTSLVPRFAYEDFKDSVDLDESVFKLATCIERVDLFPSGGTASEPSSVLIIKDSVLDTLLHYVSSSVACTVSTTALRVASRILQGHTTDPIRTTAWTCLKSEDTINGAVVCPDATYGHTLIVALTSGSLETIDVTELKSRHGFYSHFLAPSVSGSRLLLDNDPSSGDPPLVSDELAPLISKINFGLSKMARIVGSETRVKDITPDSLAVAIRTKKMCDDEVVVPLLELKETVANCRAGLNQRFDEQRAQLSLLAGSIRDLRTGLAAIGERLEHTEANAKSLAQQSADVLQKSQQLLPTITQAEYDYFQAIKRLNLRCTRMEEEFERFCGEQKTQCDTLSAETISDSVKELSKEHIKHLDVMMQHNGSWLGGIQDRLHRTDQRIQSLVAKHGTAA
jgi:hypothetical protein